MYVKNAFPFKDGRQIFMSMCFAKRTATIVLRCNRYDNVTLSAVDRREIFLLWFAQKQEKKAEMNATLQHSLASL